MNHVHAHWVHTALTKNPLRLSSEHYIGNLYDSHGGWRLEQGRLIFSSQSGEKKEELKSVIIDFKLAERAGEPCDTKEGS